MVQTLYPCFLTSCTQSVSFDKFCTLHTKIAYIRVCTALHNYLLQALIDMHSSNCVNEWRSQYFVLLLLEKFMCMLHEYLDSCTPFIDVLFVNAWLQLYIYCS